MQSDFIQGRSIIENFATAVEMVQCAHKLKKPIIVLKLDFQKAFETIHWEAIVHSWHAWFPEKWIWWIHHLLASSQGQIQINGHTGEKFCIRQVLDREINCPHTFSTLPLMFYSKWSERHMAVASLFTDCNRGHLYLLYNTWMTFCWFSMDLLNKLHLLDWCLIPLPPSADWNSTMRKAFLCP